MGKAINKVIQTTITVMRTGVSPRKEIKYNSAKWYIKPNPITAPPTGIPNLGSLKVINATRTASKIGKG